MEEIGNPYIKILLQSSLLEEVKYSIETCYKMHDLVHDLAESISMLETIKLENGEVGNHYQVRYLSLDSGDNMTGKVLKGILTTSVRTLFLKRGLCTNELPKFKNLYVLNLSGVDMKELPTSIGKLIYLRFLDLTCFRVRNLTESICKLYCLQTLRLHSLSDIPKSISNLISLTHLHYARFYEAHFQMPPEMGRLTCLLPLEFFNVREEKSCQIEDIWSLKDLKGKLMIHNLQLVNGKKGDERANLAGKPYMLQLAFEWGNNRNREGSNYDEDVLEGLQPHQNLQELVIRNFMGDQFPKWLMNLSAVLYKLVEFRLIRCKRCREVPTALGLLPFLQSLGFSGLDNLRCIGLSFYDNDEVNKSEDIWNQGI